MSVETVHARLLMAAAFEPMHDGRRLVPMALGALARGPDQLRGRLIGLNGGSAAVDGPRGGDRRTSKKHGDEDRSEGQLSVLGLAL